MVWWQYLMIGYGVFTVITWACILYEIKHATRVPADVNI